MRLTGAEAEPADNSHPLKPATIAGTKGELISIQAEYKRATKVKRKDPEPDHSHDLSFVFSSKGAMSFLRPMLRGTVDEKSGELALTAEINPIVANLLNFPINAFLGAGIGALACTYLAPDTISMLKVVVATAAVPLSLAIVGIIMLKLSFELRLPALVSGIAAGLGLPESDVSLAGKNISWFKTMFSDQTIASAISFVLTIVAATQLHAYAWDLWTNGEYAKSETLCRPVQTLVLALFGADSPVVADCNYYIAECLRCQGKYTESEKLYLKALDVLSQKMGAESSQVADAQFNLARVYEGMGRNADALAGYQKSAAVYEKLPHIGPNNGWMARVLDREAILCMKMGQQLMAEQLEKRALDIDAAYGKKGPYLSYSETLNDIGVIYFKHGRLEDAEKVFLEASDSKRVLNTPLSAAVAQYNLSLISRAMNDSRKADQFEQSARKAWLHFLGPGFIDKSSDELYKLVLEKTKQNYETPHWETRSAQTISGLGRI